MDLPTYHSNLMDIFTGRVQELHIMHSWLNDGNPLPILVVGPRGIGKTALCMAYSSIYKDLFSGVIRVSCNTVYQHSSLDEIVLTNIARYYPEVLTGPLRSKLDINEILTKLSNSSSQKPVLLILDDIEFLPTESLNKIIHNINILRDKLRTIISGSTIQLNTPHRDKILDRTLQLKNLSQQEIWQSINKRIAREGGDSKLAQKAYNTLLQRNLKFSQLTPRFLIRFLNAFYKSEDFDNSVTQALFKYFDDVSNFIITPSEERFRVLPAAQIESSEIVTQGTHSLIGVPFVIIPNFSHYWKAKLEEFEHYLNDPYVKETQIQRFFEENPQFIKGIDYRQVISQPVLERDEDGDLIPDFFLKPITSDFVDILDLKLPKKSLLVGTENRKRLSSSVTEAMAQLREYRNYFDLPEYREKVRHKYGVTGYKPNTIVVIGRTEPDIPEEKFREVISETPGHLRIKTYDELYAQMKEMVSRNLI